MKDPCDLAHEETIRAAQHESEEARAAEAARKAGEVSLLDCLNGFLYLLDMGEIGNLNAHDNDRLFRLRQVSEAAVKRAREIA